jgi:cephalosporin-C deacetylase-like acetyl esterase
MLYTYLQAQAQKHFDARRKAVAALKTPEDLKRRQEGLKTSFLAALGDFPEKTPLQARVVSKEAADGYRIERVIYESRPHHHVTAVLYLPEGPAPYPGVLVPCGHSTNGKASGAYQKVCILLAKNGLAALCYDPIGQGERSQLLNDQGKPAIAGSTSEHTMVGVGALLVGRSTASYRIWDGIRSLDYLASRPDIDPKRLGCTGNSGGGTLTAYLMALDERIVAAAPSCYITSLERLFATIGPQDAEQNITGQVAFGMEHADYVTMRAPRPTLLLVATKDFFDVQGSWTTFREAKQLYSMLHHGERVDLFENNETHGFNLSQREAAVRWMRRWLLGKDDAPVEGNLTVRKDPEMLCTRTGQVLEDFKGKSVFDLNVEKEQQLAAQRLKLQVSRGKDDLLQEVRRRIGWQSPQAARGIILPEALRREGYLVRKERFETEAGIVVPALSFWPQKPVNNLRRQPLIIYVHGNGKAVDAAAGGPIEKLVKAGYIVYAPDLRGLGETAPGTVAPNRPNYFGADFKDIFLAFHLNHPLLGLRVYDLLCIVEELAKGDKFDIHLTGIGTAGPIALHAAALSSHIKQVTIERSVISWSAVVRTPVSHNQLTNVVPGALQSYDLPDLAAAIAPRPLTIRSAVDPVHQPVSQAELEKAYAVCKTAYTRMDADNQLLLQAP